MRVEGSELDEARKRGRLHRRAAPMNALRSAGLAVGIFCNVR